MSWLPASIRRLLPGWRHDAPEAFLLEGRRPGAHTVVVCAGDSLTHGLVSASYVDRLDRQLRPAGYQIVNAGVNGDLAFNVLARLDEVVACGPDVVTLLVGTNDINARFNATWERRYRKNQGLPVAPTLDFYVSNVNAIITRLRRETKARVVLLEIPMLGEDLGGPMNGLVREYNAALHAIAAQRGLACLPLYDRLVGLLPAGHEPTPYTGDISAVMWAGVASMLARRSWDEIAQRNGLVALTDHIHLSDRAADVVAELVAGALGHEVHSICTD